MPGKRYLLLSCVVALVLNNLSPLYSQALPPIQNFSPKDYHGENQNWAISQSSDKLIYVANSKGLLAFNGASWVLYPSPNETIMRSVQVVEDRIYTGCYMEFGYWTKNDLGTLEYTSISEKISVDLIQDEEFWNIINVDDYMVFQSLKRIYIYNGKNGDVQTINTKSTITKMFKVGQGIYFQRKGEGIFKIEAGKDFLVFNDGMVKEDEVIQIFGNDDDLLILTKSNGFCQQENGKLVRSNSFPNDFLSKLSLYDARQLRDKSFVLGSISNGLIRLGEQGELLAQINQGNGLLNNTVLSLFEDVESNLWLGMDHGICYINTNSPFKVFNDTKGVLGSVYASAIYKENLYLGTNQGLFYKRLDSKDDFTFISGTQGQVWSLTTIDDTLFCGHHSGTYLVKSNQVQKISTIEGTWDIARIPDKSNLLLQGNYDGLYILEKTANSWRLRNKIKGFNNSSRYFEILGKEIFVNHEYKGVFQLRTDASFFEVTGIEKDTLIKGSNSGIVKYNGDLLYSYKKGIFKFNSSTRTFVRDSLLSNVYDEGGYESGKLIADDKGQRLWIFTKSNISLLASVGLTNTPKLQRIPLTKEMREGIPGYENILSLPNANTYLLGKTSGYLTVDMDHIESAEFEVRIASITNGENSLQERLIDNKSKADFSSDENHIAFSYYAPEYHKYLNTDYQFRLGGVDDDWSPWSEKAEVFYEYLPFGNHLFEVRARIGNEISRNTATFQFKIAKPWYISNLMIVIYVLAVLLFSFFMHMMYKQYYNKQRQKLMDRNTRAMELAQVQNEKEIIKITNEQLKIENRSKSKELAVSTMSIIKKNELLTIIKEALKPISKEDAAKQVVTIIDDNLGKNDEWELFQEAFNNADSEFLKRIKTTHPNLSPNDLRLCAYLRLNLSSKEIAPLLNISPRSVEIKRYRLRKKLNLQHEDNLVNYILAL